MGIARRQARPGARHADRRLPRPRVLRRHRADLLRRRRPRRRGVHRRGRRATTSHDLTAEDVADNWATITDREGYHVPRQPRRGDDDLRQGTVLSAGPSAAVGRSCQADGRVRAQRAGRRAASGHADPLGDLTGAHRVHRPRRPGHRLRPAERRRGTPSSSCSSTSARRCGSPSPSPSASASCSTASCWRGGAGAASDRLIAAAAATDATRRPRPTASPSRSTSSPVAAGRTDPSCCRPRHRLPRPRLPADRQAPGARASTLASTSAATATRPPRRTGPSTGRATATTRSPPPTRGRAARRRRRGWSASATRWAAPALLMAAARRPGAVPAARAVRADRLPDRPVRDGRTADNPLRAGARRRRPVFDSFEAAIANYASKPPMAAFDPDALDAYVRHGFRAGRRPRAPEVRARARGAHVRAGRPARARGTRSATSPSPSSWWPGTSKRSSRRRSPGSSPSELPRGRLLVVDRPRPLRPVHPPGDDRRHHPHGAGRAGAAPPTVPPRCDTPVVRWAPCSRCRPACRPAGSSSSRRARWRSASPASRSCPSGRRSTRPAARSCTGPSSSPTPDPAAERAARAVPRRARPRPATSTARSPTSPASASTTSEAEAFDEECRAARRDATCTMEDPTGRPPDRPRAAAERRRRVRSPCAASSTASSSRDGELVVTDYKTGRAPSINWEQKSLAGVHFYSFLCEQVLGRRPVAIRLMYLRSGETIEATPSEQSTRFITTRDHGGVEGGRAGLPSPATSSPGRARCAPRAASSAWCPSFGGDPDLRRHRGAARPHAGARRHVTGHLGASQSRHRDPSRAPDRRSAAVAASTGGPTSSSSGSAATRSPTPCSRRPRRSATSA